MAFTYWPSCSTCSCCPLGVQYSLWPWSVLHITAGPPTAHRKYLQYQQCEVTKAIMCIPSLHLRDGEHSSRKHRRMRVGRDLRTSLDQPPAPLLHAVIQQCLWLPVRWSEISRSLVQKHFSCKREAILFAVLPTSSRADQQQPC